MAILRKITHPEQKSSLIRRQTRSEFKKKFGFGSFSPQGETSQSYNSFFESKFFLGHPYSRDGEPF